MLPGRRELPLHRDDAPRYVPWIIAVMVYLAALALAGVLTVGGITRGWDRDLRNELTLQLMPVDGLSRDEQIATALEVLRGTPGVADAAPLGEAEMAALLEPWLDAGALSSELPLPALIDIRLLPGRPFDAGALAAKLDAALPGARLDDNAAWFGDVLRLAHTVQIAALAAVLLIVVGAVATVVFATRAGLAVHHDVIEVLHLIGAHDAYIAQQFEVAALKQGLWGGVLGMALAAVTLFVVIQTGQGLADASLPSLALAPAHWVLLAALPIAAALITTLTARLTVLRVLRRIP